MIETRPVEPITASRELLIRYLRDIAIKYGISYNQFYKTIEKESQFNPNAIGDDGRSLGIAQYTQDTWLENCLEFGKYEDKNPYQQLDCAGKMFKKGMQHRWTAWRILFGNKKTGD